MKTKTLQPFTIPKAIAKNFKITGDLSKEDQWKAKVVQGNSGKLKVGSWDEVGYVLISIDSNHIIPVARNDEHRSGYEVLWEHYYKKCLIPHERYIAIFAFGQNFVSHQLAKEQVEAFRRYRKYGGRNSIIHGTNQHRDYIATIDDYISGKGRLSVDKEKLSLVGQFIINKLEAIAKGVVSKRKDVFSTAYDFIQWVGENDIDLCTAFRFSVDDPEKWQAEVLKAEADYDFDGYEKLSQLFFSFHGIKNQFHNRLRDIVDVVNGEKMKAANQYEVEDVRSFWGNLNVAMREFQRLSQI